MMTRRQVICLLVSVPLAAWFASARRVLSESAASSQTAQTLSVGYSDDISVFLNGRILFRGRSAQNFRDPSFLGIINPENDAVYLPLKKGRNELLLAVSELGGGWGFNCRLADLEN